MLSRRHYREPFAIVKASNKAWPRPPKKPCGQLIAVPPAEQAVECLAGEGAPMEALPVHRRVIAGDPVTVRSALEDLARDYGAVRSSL